MIEIDSKQRLVRTGVILRAGRAYRLHATGCWKDKDKCCGPDGYRSLEYPNRAVGWLLWCVAWTRRVPRAKWFALVGIVDSPPHTKFVIGTDHTMTPLRDGELLCFANDFVLAYGNNCGSVQLAIDELE